MHTGVQDSTCEFLFQRAFMHANQAYLNSNGFLACVSFSITLVSLVSISLFADQNSSYLQLHRHRYSQETFVSLYSVLCFSIARLSFTCIFIYLSSRTSLDHSILNGLLESYSTECEFEFLDVASTRSVSYTGEKSVTENEVFKTMKLASSAVSPF